MSSSAVPTTGYEIHTGETIHRAYEAMFGSLQTIVAFAWLPFVLILAAEIIGMAVGGGGELGSSFAWILGGLAFLVFGTTFAVRWFRHLLLGESPTGELFPPAWRPVFFAAVTIALAVFAAGVVVTVIAMIISPLATLLTGLGYVAIALLALRILMMLPAAALEQPIDLRGAWDMMAGNYWHFFACALICYVPFALAEGLIGALDGAAPWLLWVVLEAARIAVAFLGLACLYAALADIYHGMTGAGRGIVTSAAA